MIALPPTRFFPFWRGILAFATDILHREGQRATPAEQDLMRRLARRDPDAAAEMVRQYGDMVYRFIYHQVGGIVEDAEDLTQETFLAALQSAHRFRGDSRLRTWLFRIAAHKIADHWRSHHRQPPELPLEDWHSIAGEEMSSFALLEETEVRDRVRAALLTLPPITEPPWCCGTWKTCRWPRWPRRWSAVPKAWNPSSSAQNRCWLRR